ncbi:stage III sporulation protein AE [Virgibacillus sp. YIM 98842]|uniref:stage III sporulation protein AE n=1 Tax=Virgibacillus sp. YIM 98842 TaxID=2663533 RepID=UPI0013DA4AA3|nr:stage III sporulation protein AE [Virgibacillus sp. YIM 98842]
MKFKGLRLIVLFIFLISLFGQTHIVFAEENSIDGSDLEEELLEEIHLDDVQHYWQELVSEYGGYLPEIERDSVYELIKSNGSFSLENMVLGLLEFIFHELILNGKLLGTLLMLTLFSVVLQTMHHALERSAVSKIAYFVVYIVLIFIALNSFYLAASYAREAIETMSSFMIALLPLILGLMASFGTAVSVSFFHPIIIFLVNMSGILVSTIILPLLFISALMLIVSSLSENYKITQLADLFKSVSLAVLGVFLTIFLGVTSVQGAASAVQDGIAMKTAKFITGNFIPVVGRTLTDAADTILSASLLLKNAVGIVGLIIILFFAVFPALKIFVIAIIYKIAAAVLQPIGGGPVITTLNTISTYILYILASLLAVSFMFFLSIVIIVAASNITVLLR